MSFTPLSRPPEPPGPWLDIIVHPQTGTICGTCYPASYSFWPADGFQIHTADEGIQVWPVPDLRGARLADCRRCGKTGIVPRTAEDAARYIPGARLEDGKMVMDVLASYTLPQGTGKDEA